MDKRLFKPSTSAYDVLIFSSSNYGQVSLTRVGSNLVSTLSQILEPCNSSKDPLTFEQLDHAYGFVLYTTTLKTGGKTFSAPNIRDAGYVFLNNNYQVD